MEARLGCAKSIGMKCENNMPRRFVWREEMLDYYTKGSIRIDFRFKN